MAQQLAISNIWRRLAALFYDLLLVIAVLLIGTLMILPFNHGHAVAPGNIYLRLYLLALISAFFIGFWHFGKQTVGMRAWRLVMLDQHGNGISLRQSCLRFALVLLNLICLGAGFFYLMIDKDKQTLYDRWLGINVFYLEIGD